MPYLKKEVNDEVYFWHADKHQKFLQIGTIVLGVWPGMPKLPKITSFVSLEYLKKEVSDKVDFLYADKHESLL